MWVKDASIAVSCGVGLRCGSDQALLWPRLAAVAIISPLAWELPYVETITLKKEQKKKKKRPQLDILTTKVDLIKI